MYIAKFLCGGKLYRNVKHCAPAKSYNFCVTHECAPTDNLQADLPDLKHED